MTESNIAEGNKLIADFIGWEFSERGFPFVPNIYPFGGYERGYTEFECENLEFHGRWDWLMPVVEKIRMIDTGDNRENNLLSYKVEVIAHAKSFSCNISKSWWPSHGRYEEELICSRVDTTSLINVTFRAVIKFIQWYNQKSNP